MPSARPRRTRRHGSRMGWRHGHARRGPGGGCCQACGARRIARWATQVVTVPRTRRGQGAAAGKDRQRLQRHWRDGWQVTAGGNGRLEARVALRVCGSALRNRAAHSTQQGAAAVAARVPLAAASATAASARQRRLQDDDVLHRVDRVHERHPLLLKRLRRARTREQSARAVVCVQGCGRGCSPAHESV